MYILRALWTFLDLVFFSIRVSNPLPCRKEKKEIRVLEMTSDLVICLLFTWAGCMNKACDFPIRSLRLPILNSASFVYDLSRLQLPSGNVILPNIERDPMF